ncbi:MAG: hypothetical protein LBU64_11595 [Planctomycetota bacterium]|nr:hypothetical protein [Planctomycetota bacterium]
MTFFSRLTETLENALGGGAVAERLAAARRNEPEGAAGPACERAFRRLGFEIAGEGDFLSVFSVRAGEAASRPARQVRALFKLFAEGEAGAGLDPVCGASPNCPACRLTRECDYFNAPRKPDFPLSPPAERLRAGNPEALSDPELLALLLWGERPGGREGPANSLLARHGGLAGVFQAETREYFGLRDLERAPALRLAAAAVLHRRLLAASRSEVARIASAGDLYARYGLELRGTGGETVILALLDAGGHIIRDIRLRDRAAAGLAGIAMPDILRPALREGAARLAIVRRQPAGAASPSEADRDFARRLGAACGILDLTLLDYLVAGENDYYSFAEAGLLS